MSRNDASVRDRGLVLVSRCNRWLVAGAAGLSAVLSVAAANAFHGHHRTPSSQSVDTSSSAQQQSSGSSGSLEQPAQVPAPAPVAPSGGGVVSGGS